MKDPPMIYLSPEDKKASARTYFMRGLLFVVPIAITLWLVGFVLGLANDWLGSIVGALVRLLLPVLTHLPATGLGLLISVVSMLLLCALLTGIGKLASYRIGKEGLRLVDHLFIHIPGVNSVYRATRKMVEAFGDSGASFQRCVWLRFPASYYTLGFVTKEIAPEGGRKLLVVFVPHCPNPTGGFTQVVPEDETRASDISPDEGLKLVLSMGVLTPENLPKLY
jgi:uncharacterized membrane protein